MLAPRICCLDLDTFFVSVERLLDPSLCGKRVIVDRMRDKFGYHAVHLATTLTRGRRRR